MSNEQRIKLDEILKSLFAVSKKVLMKMMNGLFEEKYDLESTEITFENNEFITDNDDIIRADLMFRLINQKKPYHYHIELQTKNDSTMIIRMFEYGFMKAKELVKYEEVKGEETVIYIPKQLVIFIEENSRIKNELRMKLIFPDGQFVNYVVPVMKYWEYSDKQLISQNMYPLLPLQVFVLRSKLEKIKRKQGEGSKELTKLMLQVKETTINISKEAKELYDKKEIDGDDLHKILLATSNNFEYLNEKYVNDELLNKEVFEVTKTLYDPEVEYKEKLKIAVNALQEGFSVEVISKITELEVNIIEKLKRELDCKR